MLFDLGLQWQETIEAAIQPRVVDLACFDVQQIVQRRGGIPVLFHGQLAARRTQPVDRQYRGDARPGYIGAIHVQMLRKELSEPQLLP